MPYVPESLFGSFNWILTLAQHTRLLSRAMTTLFCAGICQMEPDYYKATISQLFEDLEQWRLSIPEGFRPGLSCQPHLFRRPVTGPPAIWINYLYYGFKLIILRCNLQINEERDQSESNKNLSRENLIAVSRSILEIITYVDVEPSTPLWSVIIRMYPSPANLTQDFGWNSNLCSLRPLRPSYQRPQTPRYKEQPRASRHCRRSLQPNRICQ